MGDGISKKQKFKCVVLFFIQIEVNVLVSHLTFQNHIFIYPKVSNMFFQTWNILQVLQEILLFFVVSAS
jgi:hypothetical protein